MKNFVKLIERVHAERFSVVLNKITARKIPVAFLSLAPVAQAVELVKNLRAQNLDIMQLIVIDSTLPPSQLDFEVVHVSDAVNLYPQLEYIFVTGNVDARFAIKKFPAAKVISLNKGDSEQAYEMFMTHLDDLREVYESLIDEQSKKTFRGYWLGNIACRLGDFVYSDAPHYLISGFVPQDGGIVIEAGAFDGGTAAVFADMGYKVHTFEMDKINYERTRKVAEEKNFVVENCGLGSFKHVEHYDSTGRNFSKLTGNGNETVEIIKMDAYVREKKLPRVDMIKLDVEGAELDVLRGAAATIIRFKPILALSAYHKFDDFWTLMNFVKSLRPDYEFAMHQSYETPEEEPSHLKEGNIFKGVSIDFLRDLDLEPDNRNFNECVLFAR